MTEAEFMQILSAESSDYIEIREISPEGAAGKPLFFRPDQIPQYQPPQDRHVYIGVYGRKGKRGTAKGCTTTRALWADYDNTDQKEAAARIKAAGLPDPSILISSGNGIHAYWMLNRRAGEEALPVVKAIAAATKADPRATDKARVMRLPGTNNIKGEPKPCRVLEYSGEIHRLEDFPQGAAAQKESPEEQDSLVMVGRLIVDRPCIAEMLQGVPQGVRNFALGRITKYFQQMGLDRPTTWAEIKNWNKRNQPPEDQEILWQSFRAYWKGGYNLLGCRIPAEGLQAILQPYCDRPKCSIQAAVGDLEIDQASPYNNRIFNEIHNLNGYDLIIYGLLLKYPEGLAGSELSEHKRDCMTEERMVKALEELQRHGLIEIDGRLRSQGKSRRFFAKAKPQGTYGKGYTLVSNGAIQGAVTKDITAAEFRLYVLLLSYAYGKGICYPSQHTLAVRLRHKNRQTVAKQLNELQQKGYILRYYKDNRTICKLLI